MIVKMVEKEITRRTVIASLPAVSVARLALVHRRIWNKSFEGNEEIFTEIPEWTGYGRLYSGEYHGN